MWMTQSFPLKFTNHFQRSNADGYRQSDIVFDFETTCMCTTGSTTIQSGLWAGKQKLTVILVWQSSMQRDVSMEWVIQAVSRVRMSPKHTLVSCPDLCAFLKFLSKLFEFQCEESISLSAVMISHSKLSFDTGIPPYLGKSRGVSADTLGQVNSNIKDSRSWFNVFPVWSGMPSSSTQLADRSWSLLNEKTIMLAHSSVITVTSGRVSEQCCLILYGSSQEPAKQKYNLWMTHELACVYHATCTMLWS